MEEPALIFQCGQRNCRRGVFAESNWLSEISDIIDHSLNTISNKQTGSIDELLNWMASTPIGLHCIEQIDLDIFKENFVLYDISFIFVALFALGFTIFIHELGHFLGSPQTGIGNQAVSPIGFGPKIFGWTRNGVEYRLSAIPFGGYAAFPQLVDMGQIGGGRRRGRERTKPSRSRDKEEEDNDGEDEKGEAEETLPKISYADKMIVSVMGAVFQCASCIRAFLHPLESSDMTLPIPNRQPKSDSLWTRSKRWNPACRGGRGNCWFRQKSGYFPLMMRFWPSMEYPWKTSWKSKPHRHGQGQKPKMEETCNS